MYISVTSQHLFWSALCWFRLQNTCSLSHALMRKQSYQNQCTDQNVNKLCKFTIFLQVWKIWTYLQWFPANSGKFSSVNQKSTVCDIMTWNWCHVENLKMSFFKIILSISSISSLLYVGRLSHLVHEVNLVSFAHLVNFVKIVYLEIYFSKHQFHDKITMSTNFS